KKDDPDSLSGSSFVGSVTLFFYLFSLTVGFHFWIRYSLNGGYEPQIPNATRLTIKELDHGNFLFEVRLFDGRDYKILLPLVKKGQ
ncbi:hypothetical protein ACIQ9H_08625, partial [Aerococcus viridans]